MGAHKKRPPTPSDTKGFIFVVEGIECSYWFRGKNEEERPRSQGMLATRRKKMLLGRKDRSLHRSYNSFAILRRKDRSLVANDAP